MSSRRILIAAVAIAGLSAAGCGSDKTSSDTSSAGSIATPTTATTPATVAAGATTSSAASDVSAPMSSSSDSAGTMDSSASSGSLDTKEVEDRYERAKAALQDGDFSTMLSALELSGLSDEINKRDVTVLAPTNEAFGSLSGQQMTDIISNADKVKDILRRHILDQAYTYDELAALSEVTTLSGEKLTVTSNGDTLQIDGATVGAPGTEQLSGETGQEIAVFTIDRVLLEGE